VIEVGEVDGEPALQLIDQEAHEGREVAISEETLTSELGYAPEVAEGRHSSGEVWVSPIEYRGGYAVIDVPHFSENTVTFGGEISIEAAPAETGDTFTYSIADPESVGDVSIEITGAPSTSERSIESQLSDLETMSYEPNGTAPPSSGEISITGVESPGDGGETDSISFGLGSSRWGGIFS
jgi:hypothetical protein